MFCEKCGKPTEGDQKLCSSCAAEQSAISSENTQIAQAEDTFQLHDTNTVPVKKTSKKKAGLIAGIVALAIVAAAILGIVFNRDSINGFIDRTFQSPEEYLANVESAYIAEQSAALAQSYGVFLENLNANQTAGEAEIRLTLDKEVLSILETMLQQQGMKMDLDWLKEIKMSVNANVQDTAMQMVLGIGLGKNDLLSADVIYDMENSKGYLTIPELNKNYLYADLSSGISNDQIKELISQSMEMRSKLLKALPSEEEMNALINSYAEIALSGIDNVEKQNETITVNDVSQNMVVLTAKITQEDLLDIAEKLLVKAEKDQTLKKVLTAFGDYVNEVNGLGGSDYSVDIYQDFADSIPDLLDSLEEARQGADSSNYVELKVYVDMKNAVRGHELAVFSDGEQDGDPISWLTVVDGNTTYTEAELGDARITGKKTEDRGTSEGSYVLYVDGTKICTLKFENMTESSGTLRLFPSADVLDEALSESGIPTFLLGDNLGLKLSYDMQGNQVSYGIGILMGSKDMISLDLSSAASDGGKISVPTNALDVTSESDVIQWLKGADFDTLLKAMEDCNIPKDLVDVARSYVSTLQDQLG